MVTYPPLGKLETFTFFATHTDRGIFRRCCSCCWWWWRWCWEECQGLRSQIFHRMDANSWSPWQKTKLQKEAKTRDKRQNIESARWWMKVQARVVTGLWVMLWRPLRQFITCSSAVHSSCYAVVMMMIEESRHFVTTCWQFCLTCNAVAWEIHLSNKKCPFLPPFFTQIIPRDLWHFATLI